MIKVMKRAAILFGVFVIAAAVYFIWIRNDIEKEIVYTSMSDAVLPVMYTEYDGTAMNYMHGYLNEMDQGISRDSLTVLSENRSLMVRINHEENTVTGFRYEIRSLDLNRLIEKTTVEQWETSEELLTVVLPIQNLIKQGTQYLLHMSMDTEQYGTVHYYTRVIWGGEEHIGEMIQFALGFPQKTMNYESARELTTYLETKDTEDNSTLGKVTIRSNFSQLTWAGMEIQMESSPRLTLKEIDGLMTSVQIDYLAARNRTDGGKEIYEVTDYFTMKWNGAGNRIYLMDYNRETNQIFTGERELYSGKRILLGIENVDQLSVKKSKDGKKIAFVVNRDLWSFDQKGNQAVRVYSFRSKEDEIRSGYNHHNIKIITVADTGDIDFAVYGYMNRGSHEGNIGIIVNHYDAESNSIQERFFIPMQQDYQEIGFGLDQLLYCTESGMLYLYANHAIYGIDLNSNEYVVVADALSEGSYAVSLDGSHIAWQDGNDLYRSHAIHLMNLENGDKKDIMDTENQYFRTLGFVGNDFVYGIARPGSEWYINGRMEEMPMYALEIVNDTLQVENHYEKQGRYLTGVTVGSGRIHIKRLMKVEAGYQYYDEDTIVCNDYTEPDRLNGIGWYASEDRRKVYFVQLDTEIKSGRNVKISTPKKLSRDVSEKLELKSNFELQGMLFYAYGGGKLLAVTQDFTKAVKLAYTGMGFVTDQYQRILWDRVNRRNSSHIREPWKAAYYLLRGISANMQNAYDTDGNLILDGRGLELNQILYFVDQGCPVAAYIEDGKYLLITGYDSFNISLYNPDTGESWKMGISDSTQYFAQYGNDFICGISTK